MVRRPAPWAELSGRLAASPPWSELARRLEAGRAVATRLPPAAAAWVFDLFAERDGRLRIVVVPHEGDALAWLEALRLVAGAEVGAYFASPSLSPYQEIE